MPKLEKETLEKTLNHMFDVLFTHKMLPGNPNKKDLVEGVVNKLEHHGYDIHTDDLDLHKNPEQAKILRDALMMALVSEHLAKHDPKLRFNFEKIFKPRGHGDKEIIKKEIKEELIKMYMLINLKLEPGKRKTPKQIEDLVERDLNSLTDQYMKTTQPTLAHNKNFVDLFSSAVVSVSLLYGGINLKFPGGAPIIVQQLPEQNPNGFIDYNIGGGRASVMQNQNTAEPGQQDFKGQEAITIWNAIAKGTIPQDLEVQMQQSGMLKENSSRSPFHTKPVSPTSSQ